MLIIFDCRDFSSEIGVLSTDVLNLIIADCTSTELRAFAIFCGSGKDGKLAVTVGIRFAAVSGSIAI